jgi:UDP-N-acetylmuramoyl-tripeptide--D-alanyl-D-alanine ligase
MRELGEASRGEHIALGRALAESGAVVLIAVGGDAEHYVEPARARMEAHFAADSLRAIAPVLACVKPGDVVLVKASRGIHAERVVEALLDAKGRAA